MDKTQPLFKQFLSISSIGIALSMIPTIGMLVSLAFWYFPGVGQLPQALVLSAAVICGGLVLLFGVVQPPLIYDAYTKLVFHKSIAEKIFPAIFSLRIFVLAQLLALPVISNSSWLIASAKSNLAQTYAEAGGVVAGLMFLIGLGAVVMVVLFYGVLIYELLVNDGVIDDADNVGALYYMVVGIVLSVAGFQTLVKGGVAPNNWELFNRLWLAGTLVQHLVSFTTVVILGRQEPKKLALFLEQRLVRQPVPRWLSIGTLVIAGGLYWWLRRELSAIEAIARAFLYVGLGVGVGYRLLRVKK